MNWFRILKPSVVLTITLTGISAFAGLNLPHESDFTNCLEAIACPNGGSGPDGAPNVPGLSCKNGQLVMLVPLQGKTLLFRNGRLKSIESSEGKSCLKDSDGTRLSEANAKAIDATALQLIQAGISNAESMRWKQDNQSADDILAGGEVRDGGKFRKNIRELLTCVRNPELKSKMNALFEANPSLKRLVARESAALEKGEIHNQDTEKNEAPVNPNHK